MKIFNMVIPILMHFCNFLQIEAKPHVIQQMCQTISDSISQDILSQILTLSNQTSHYKSKQIRILILLYFHQVRVHLLLMPSLNMMKQMRKWELMVWRVTDRQQELSRPGPQTGPSAQIPPSVRCTDTGLLILLSTRR